MPDNDATDNGDLPDERSDPIEPAPGQPVKNMDDLVLQGVFNAAFHVTRNEAAALDISQNVYLEVLILSANQLAIIGCLQAYAQTAARNRALNWRRDHGHEFPWEILEGTPQYPKVDPIPDINRWQDLMRQLEKFSDDRKDAFVLYRIFGYSAAEIAAQFGTTPDAILKKVSRVEKRLRRMLNEPPRSESPPPNSTQRKEQK